MKRILVLVIALLAVGLTVVSAQTRQQQQELEQIAMRSMNGLSAQDRQRAVQIMTDVYVAQGMARQQASSLAEMAVDSMFTTDYQEDAQSAEARRMVQDQQQQNNRRGQLVEEVPEGATKGWPSNRIFDNHSTFRLSTPTINTPHGITVSYEIEDYTNLVLIITKKYMDNNHSESDWSDREVQWFINYIQQASGVTVVRGDAYFGYRGITSATRDNYATTVSLILDSHRLKIILQKNFVGSAGGR